MKRSLITTLTVFVVGILFSGCSFADIFSKLATSNLEQGAQEEYTQSKIIEAKQQKIEQKKQQFSQWVELKNVNESTGYVAYVFLKQDGESTQVDVEAMLSNPDHQAYEVWVRGKNLLDKTSLGILKFNQIDDYSLSFSGKLDAIEDKTILISREADLNDKKIETILMTGTFSTASASPDVAAQK